MTKIPFNRPYIAGDELKYVAEALTNNHLAGDGPFTRLCSAWMEQNTGCARALLTHSCTASLEMSAILLNIGPGDEVIMPSYTFVSTANAFVLRGAIPVFVDIRADTLNLNESLIEDAITPRTKAIVVVHYAGVACEMDAIMGIANRYGLKVVEDAAQGIMSKYKGRALGSIGHFGTFSFHETKNITAGEGGALLVNEPALASRAEIVREKGTDRSRFLRGEVDKYTWQEIGSSYLPSEMVAAFLWAQLREAISITAMRMSRWAFYHACLADMENEELLRRPIVPSDCLHNAHMYYILLPSKAVRQRVLTKLKENHIHAVTHYVPLHSSPAGRHHGRSCGSLDTTKRQSERLLRLPLWAELSEHEQVRVVEALNRAMR